MCDSLIINGCLVICALAGIRTLSLSPIIIIAIAR